MSDFSPNPTASQFYTGLVAELYDPLASYRPRADEYIPFLERSGTPALELACGSGRPLLDLVERGYDVEGLDASRDMLDRCGAHAADRGLSVTLHEAEMQSFSLPRRYRSIFIAGGSFGLLANDDDALQTLERMHAHLEPAGSILIPLTLERAEPTKQREPSPWVTLVSGERVRCTQTAAQSSADARDQTQLLRYERTTMTGAVEVLEREFRYRLWSQAQFAELLRAARFDKVSFLAPLGGRSHPDAAVFVALAR